MCIRLCVCRKHGFLGTQPPGFLVASVVQPAAIEVSPDLPEAGAREEGLVGYIV